MRRTFAQILAAGLAFIAGPSLFAAEIVHQSPQGFLAERLPGCKQKALWLKSDAKEQVESLLQRPFSGVRIRYCELDQRTAWILDEIGKTEPITTGVVVAGGRVEGVKVLVFRESRGGEVHREAFTSQYRDSSLREGSDLDRNIDGITGATMSVDAVNLQVRLALLLDGMVREKNRDG